MLKRKSQQIPLQGSSTQTDARLGLTGKQDARATDIAAFRLACVGRAAVAEPSTGLE